MNVLAFGEILWDVYPDRKCLGGAPLNFAAHLARHGERSFMLSAVGDDRLGAEALAQVRQWGVSTEHIAVLPEKQTGCCLVTLDERLVPSYNLLRDVAYDHIPCDNLSGEFDVLYFGTLALRSEANRRTLEKLLAERQFKEVFVDVNIRPPFYSAETVRFAVENATILKVSEEELPVLWAALGSDAATDYEAAAKQLAASFKNLSCVIMTLGEKGAYVLLCKDGAACHRDSEAVEVRSTVGAGDSFCAAFLAKHLQGCPMDACLKHAVKVAGFVVSEYDAVPDYAPEDLL